MARLNSLQQSETSGHGIKQHPVLVSKSMIPIEQPKLDDQQSKSLPLNPTESYSGDKTNKSVLNGKSPSNIWGSDSEGEDSIADINFWTSSNPKFPSPIISTNSQNLQKSVKSSRSERADRRQVWRRARGETEETQSSNNNNNTRRLVGEPEPGTNSFVSDDSSSDISLSPCVDSLPLKELEIHSRPSNAANLDTPKKSQPKTLSSPTKSPKKIPKLNLSPNRDDFWTQEVMDDWNEQFSPGKDIRSTEKSFIVDDDSDLEELLSPTISPSKQDKETKQLRKVFESTKHKMAQDFLARLDKEITNGQLAKLTQETGGISLVWNKKLNTTAGRAHWRRTLVTTDSTNGISTTDNNANHNNYHHHASIELSTKVITTTTRLHNTLAHEFSHLATFMLSNGAAASTRPHGAAFQRWGRACTAAFAGELGVRVTTRHTYAIAYKYAWQCGGCARLVERHSRSVVPERHRCGACAGVLVQVRPAVRGGEVAGKTKKKTTSEYQGFVKENFGTVRSRYPMESMGFVMKMLGEMYREHKAIGQATTTTTTNLKDSGVEDITEKMNALSHQDIADFEAEKENCRDSEALSKID